MPARAPSVYVGPQPDGPVARAVEAGGARVAAAPEDAGAAVWVGGPRELPSPLPASWRWVQLPSAGVEAYVDAGVLDDDRAWTSAADGFGRAVAEHALALLLAGLRGLPAYARARSWAERDARLLDGTRIVLVGAGAIGRALIDLLAPWDVEVTAVTRSGREVAGAAASLPTDRLGEAWGAADAVVLAVPSTPETHHLVGAAELAALPAHALLVNVARGALVDTDALVEALRSGAIGGAALDVTDPEPLPDGHPLWDAPNVLVTPHVAEPAGMQNPLFLELVADNVRRWLADEPLRCRIDVARGY